MQHYLRLRRTEDFARLRQEGYTVQNRWMLLSMIPNGLSHNRYGFVTAKRLGKAVVRNRVRRLIRESVRALHPKLAIGHDMVIIARQPIVEQPYVEVARSVSELCHQAGLLEIESGEQ
jgi:ribonuclease P protein component